MELLPKDVQLIVHRYIVGDVYRTLNEEYNSKSKECVGGGIVVRLIPEYTQLLNWRHIEYIGHCTYAWEIYSKRGSRAGHLSPNYNHLLLYP